MQDGEEEAEYGDYIRPEKMIKLTHAAPVAQKPRIGRAKQTARKSTGGMAPRKASVVSCYANDDDLSEEYDEEEADEDNR